MSEDMVEYYGEDLLGGPDGKQILEGTGLRLDEGIVQGETTMHH